MLQVKVTQKQYNPLLIALGSNAGSRFGDPKATVLMAFRHIEAAGMALWAKSRLYASPAFPAGAGPDFVNAAAIIESPLSPDEILNQLHLIESAFDRTRENRWGARSLDLDLIAAGDTVLPDENTFQTWADLALPDQKIQTPGQLILPHPRLQDRAFVLIPLADVAPNWMHPVLGKTVNQMIDGLSATQRAEIVAI